MKKHYYFIVFFMLGAAISSCKNECDEVQSINVEKYLPKFPQKTIQILAGIDNALSKYGDEKINTRASFLIKDSVWSNGKGHSLIYETNEHSVTEDVVGYIYLGSILRGGSIDTQRFTPISKATDPVNISYSFPSRWVTDQIMHPSLSAQRQSVRNVMEREGMNGNQICSFSYDMSQFTYYNEVKLAFGCNINVAKVLNISIDVAQNKIRKKTGLIAKFIQKNFTIDMDIPIDGNLLLNNEELNGIDDYDPVYISSVTYGRLGTITIESNYTYDELRVAPKAAFEAKIINDELNLSYEYKKILEESDMHLSIINGDGSGVKAIEGFNEFKEFIVKGGKFTKELPGDIIFYTASYLSDNSPYYAKFKVDTPY